MSIKTSVYAKLIVEGIHNWANCPIEEVSYLRDLHRHQFHIIAHRYVYHDDRDIEFIEFQHKIRAYLTNKYWSDKYKCCLFGSMSCEMIGSELLEKFGLFKCEVSEDGECGAIVEKV